MLPETLQNAILKIRSNYNRGRLTDYSVTELCDAPHKVYMRHKYPDISQPLEDQIYAVLGSSIHDILQRSDFAITEKRIYSKIDGFVISGQFDRLTLANGQKLKKWQKILILHCKKYRRKFSFKLQDYKVCSIYEYNNLKPERFDQIEMYVYLLQTKGYRIDGAEIIQVFRDWSKIKAAKTEDYPKKQYAVYNIDLKYDGLERIKNRIGLHLTNHISMCTDEECWAKGGNFAVMAKGKKRAVKLFDLLTDAEEFIKKFGKTDLYIDKRNKEYIRCLYYCEYGELCGRKNIKA